MPPATRRNLTTLLQDLLGDGAVTRFSDYLQQHQPVVFVGPYEHHSNEISWRESLATVAEVRLDSEGAIDLEHLERLLQDPAYQGRKRIGSFSAASNVTGMRTPVHEIAALLHQHDAIACFDFAASAPYVEIDMNPPPGKYEGDASLDAIFISPHKFLGGPGATGVLVFNKRIYHPELPPSVSAGGTVDYVGPNCQDFIEDIEEREKAGTPGVLQILKAGLAFQLKDHVGVEAIEEREGELLSRTFERWKANPLVIDKWFALQAQSGRLDTLKRVERLLGHPDFSLTNPNRVRALVGAFTVGNPVRFHAADGAGYRFLGDRIIELDPLNPQIASRLLYAITRWRRYDEARQHQMREQLERILEVDGLSNDVYEVVSKSLEAS